MTSDEIMGLIATFVEHRFSHPPHDVTVFLAMQAAVQLVVAEWEEVLDLERPITEEALRMLRQMAK